MGSNCSLRTPTVQNVSQYTALEVEEEQRRRQEKEEEEEKNRKKNAAIGHARSSANALFNQCSLFWWLIFSVYMLSQPWLSNWANNKWHDYNAIRTVYYVNDTSFEKVEYKTRYGICTTPLSDMVCTDGENFTELALKYRPRHPFGCGCGEGILGEGLCPRSFYGYTLSDYVSTAPALGAMLGFAFFPLMGLTKVMKVTISGCNPSFLQSRVLYGSLTSFQAFFILWGIASVCIFPKAHAILTVAFLGSFMVFALMLLWVLRTGDREGGKHRIEESILFFGAVISFIVITAGAIPRIALTIDNKVQKPWFPNLNHGFGSYVFWLGEAIGLSIFFGLHPLVAMAKHIEGAAEAGSGFEFWGSAPSRSG